MNEEIDERAWTLARELVDRLDPRSVDEVEKIQVYLRTRGQVDACKSLVKALATNADRFTTMTQEQQERRGVSFIRSANSAIYYQNISSTLNVLFDSGLDAREQALILGWAIRLLRYYRTDEGAPELEALRRGASISAKGQRTPREAPAQKNRAEASTPMPTNRQAKPQRIKRTPPPVQTETTLAEVTLLAPAYGRRAKVQTEGGEEVICVLLPAYPIAGPGDVCRAELTRENGQLVRAVFKGWTE